MRRQTRLSALAALAALWACGGEPDTGAAAVPSGTTAAVVPANDVARVVAGGDAVFGIRPSELTVEQGAAMARVQNADFVFTTLERGPWDLPALGAFLDGMREAAEASSGTMRPLPVLLRIPPLHELGADSAG